MLREWKQRQLDVSDKRGGGWDLTDDEVEEVGRLSMRIGIWNSQVALGGEGGRAPGAGGGGGGAIGPGAMGGKGGQGGRLREDGVDPGKGGDGGRVPKLGSAGGGGGGSGGRTKATLEVRSAQTMKVHVGRGGRPGALGVHGEDGQDTFITDEDGNVLANAKGGRGGGPGHVGAEPRDATTEDVEQGLRATSMFCADCVQLRHGLVYVLGGGWEYYSVTELPCSVDVLVTVILDMSGLETDVNLNLTLAAVNVTGKVVGERRLTASVGTPRPVVLRAFPVPLRIEAEERGVYTIRLTSGAIELGSLPLEIRVGTAS